ncbi:hypothetical protein [Pedobacter namyangjuensis]|uniref:hypothetical protein n=1 Tax=Pedobacter namyangjuensis TaxID=600626 RepID=UPI0037423B0E
MLLSGDELGRSQGGSNNAYCQDNEISWLNWADADLELFAFVKTLISLRKQHPVFSRKKWFRGEPIRGLGVKDIQWFQPDGTEMEDHNWDKDFARSLGVFLSGDTAKPYFAVADRLADSRFYLIFNAHSGPLDFHLPHQNHGLKWELVLTTCDRLPGGHYLASDSLCVSDRSIAVLKSF